MQIERTKNAVRNMYWGYLYRVVNILMPFIFRTVMIRIMGASYLGINGLFTSILQVLNLSELGFGAVMVYSMYEPIAKDNRVQICELLQYYRRIYLVIGCIIMGIGLILLPFIPHLIAGNYPDNINVYFVYFMFLLNSSLSYFLFAYRGALLNAFQRNDIESKILVFVSIIRYSLEIAGIYITRQYYSFLIIEILATMLANIIKFLCTKKMYPNLVPCGYVSQEKKRDIKNNVMALMCHKIGGVVLNSVDTIILSIFMGVITVANYTNYYYILNAVESTIIIIFTGMTAGIGNSFITESVEKNSVIFKKILFLNAWIVGWSSVCLACLYQDFMELWVGRDYMYGDAIVLLLVVYFFIHTIRRTIIAFRDGAGMWRDNKWQPIISAMCNLVLNILLVNIFGLAGVLISSIISMLIIDIPWESVKFCERIKMKVYEYILLLIKYFVITAIVVACMYLALSKINMGLIMNLLIKGCLCIVIPNFIFWIIYHMNEEYVYFECLIKRILKNKIHKIIKRS